METPEILACHHRRVVEEFIESVLDELDLGDLERNALGVAIRREVEVGLVPGIIAIQALFPRRGCGDAGDGVAGVAGAGVLGDARGGGVHGGYGQVP